MSEQVRVYTAQQAECMWKWHYRKLDILLDNAGVTADEADAWFDHWRQRRGLSQQEGENLNYYSDLSVYITEADLRVPAEEPNPLVGTVASFDDKCLNLTASTEPDWIIKGKITLDNHFGDSSIWSFDKNKGDKMKHRKSILKLYAVNRRTGELFESAPFVAAEEGQNPTYMATLKYAKEINALGPVDELKIWTFGLGSYEVLK